AWASGAFRSAAAPPAAAAPPTRNLRLSSCLSSTSSSFRPTRHPRRIDSSAFLLPRLVQIKGLGLTKSAGYAEVVANTLRLPSSRPAPSPTLAAAIADEIRGRIVRGELAPGTRLPPERVLVD